MVGKAITRRVVPSTMSSRIDENIEHPQTSTSASSTLFFDPQSSVTTSKEVAQVDDLIRRYLGSCQYKLAMIWADKRLALCRLGGERASAVDMAKYLQVLSSAGDWSRVIAFCNRNDLVNKHLVFAYFYINALFKQKLYFDILKLKLTNLEGFDDPISNTASGSSSSSKLRCRRLADETFEGMNRIAEEYKLEAGLFILLGKSCLLTQNRHSALLYLRSAVRKEPTAIEALDLLKRYNLVSKRQLNEIIERSISCSKVGSILLRYHSLIHFFESCSDDLHPNVEPLVVDLSVRTARAAFLYNMGDTVGANNITTEIMEEAGIFQDCLLVHIATLVQLGKYDQLFMLAHQLVDSEPECEVSWYAVGCYYYASNQPRAAKSFLNKCTILNPLFGEGWIAFGHELTAESEHEQAMNCYLRASRVLEGSFEPLMYIGLEYSYANNMKLAQDFLKDASAIAGNNPLVMHEEGCIFYAKKDWLGADVLFMKALRLAYNETDESISLNELLIRPLSAFWEPLINNIGHVKRKLGDYHAAVKFHQKSLTMYPKKADSMAALAFSTACNGELELAVQYFLRALVLDPEYTFCRECMEKIMEWAEENSALAVYQLTLNMRMNSAIPDESEWRGTEEDKQRQSRVLDAVKRKARQGKRKFFRPDLQTSVAPRSSANLSSDDISMDISMDTSA